jgi:formylglycine-generating enzyme required for sulfatase activity
VEGGPESSKGKWLAALFVLAILLAAAAGVGLWLGGPAPDSTLPLLAATNPTARPTLPVNPRADSTPTAGGAEGAADLDLGGGVKLALVLIEPGAFLMGSPDREDGHYEEEGPQHRVTLTEPFYLGKHPVTVGQFKRFVAEDHYRTEAEKEDSLATWNNPGFAQTDKHPVVNVSWNDAKAFCAWLGRRSGRQVRLPTEAEWEYSCRAGSKTRYHFGDEEGQLGEYAWYSGNQEGGYTRPVDDKPANAFGLCGMHGNVRQWCENEWRKYSTSNEVEAANGGAAAKLAVRGSSFDAAARDCRSAYRDKFARSDRSNVLGFRVLVAKP